MSPSINRSSRSKPRKATVELPSPVLRNSAGIARAAGTLVSVEAALLTVEAATPADGGPVLVGHGISDSAGWSKALPPCPRAQQLDALPSWGHSPLVRRLAHDHGVDVRQVRGSGPDGIVLRHDVESVIARKAPDAARSRRAPSPIVRQRTIPLRGARRPRSTDCPDHVMRFPRRRYGSTLTRPSCSTARAELNANPDATPVSILGLLARFAIAGLGRYPELNSRVEADRVVLVDRVNLGFAAQTDHGLVVPVVQDAQQLSNRVRCPPRSPGSRPVLARVTDASRAHRRNVSPSTTTASSASMDQPQSSTTRRSRFWALAGSCLVRGWLMGSCGCARPVSSPSRLITGHATAEVAGGFSATSRIASSHRSGCWPICSAIRPVAACGPPGRTPPHGRQMRISSIVTVAPNEAFQNVSRTGGPAWGPT